MSATGLRSLPRSRVVVPVAGAVALLLVVTLAGLHARGDGGFASDPVGASALAAGGLLALHCGAGWLGTALLAYLAAAAWAVATGSALAVAVWNAAWIPPLVLAQLAVTAAVRQAPGPAWDTRLVAGVLGAATAATFVLTTATDPFAGLPTIAPESWRTALAPVGDALTLAGVVALLVLPVRLGRAALTSSGPTRGRLGMAAVGTTSAPLVVVFCLLLAVARSPGDVEPELGSVAFLVALAGGSVFACGCAVLASRAAVPPVVLLRVVRAVLLGAAVLVALAGGTLLAAPAVGWGPTATAAGVAVLTLGAVGGAWTLAGRFAALLAVPPEPVPAPAARAVAALTARENEVLALLAEGASNAGIAAQLVISERTVDAHLRSVFGKLQLRTEPDANRRVQAARIWLQESA